MSSSVEGVMPLVTPGFPNGASSAKEAVNLQMQKEGEIQANTNGILGGRRISYKRKRANRIKMLKRFSKKMMQSASKKVHFASKKVHFASKKMQRVSRKKQLSRREKRRKDSKRRNRRTYKGGLVEGEQLEVPQFGPSVGPLNPNKASVETNSLLLKTKQDATYDDLI